MGNGFGQYETARIIITETGDLLKDRSNSSYGTSTNKHPQPYRIKETDYVNKVEINDMAGLDSGNGSTVRTYGSVDITIYINGERFFKKDYNQEDTKGSNPIWKRHCDEDLLEHFVERLQANTFDHYLFKAFQGRSKDEIKKFFHSMLLAIKQNPERYGDGKILSGIDE